MAGVSKLRRIRIDVYGRFRIDVIRRHGTWTAFRLGDDGKRSRLTDVVLLGEDMTAEEILEAVEALYHEQAAPDAELSVIDLLMA